MQIDLNADVGESSGTRVVGDDRALMPHVTSVSIACGAHAGDLATMRDTLRLARAHGVAAGAHPGFADRDGFGRREQHLSPVALEDLVRTQLQVLADIAREEDVPLSHVKPHGALYNMACRRRDMADAICRAVATCSPGLAVLGLPGSALIDAAHAAGLRAVNEGFIDRAYHSDGRLVSRAVPGAVLHDLDLATARAVTIVTTKTVPTVDGPSIALPVDTLCIHGDTPGASIVASLVRAALTKAGVDVRRWD
ncbi:MAG: LamB/YcsF family protein [Acidobacteria bacterium]|nr:LamB/YcsF family protein [Acidobacteriota bacterium]